MCLGESALKLDRAVVEDIDKDPTGEYVHLPQAAGKALASENEETFALDRSTCS